MSRNRLPSALLIGFVLFAGCLGGTGSPAETTGDSPTTGTARAVHADYFTRHFVYLVDADSLVRREVTDTDAPDTSAAPTSQPSDASDGGRPVPTRPVRVESASV